MDSEERTEWNAMAMNPGSDGYFKLKLAASSVPDRHMFKSAYLQVQIVGTKQGGEELLRTAVLADQIMLLACSEARPGIVPTDTPAVVLPQCSDGIDNDGDGDVDMDDDRCLSPQDDNEAG